MMARHPVCLSGCLFIGASREERDLANGFAESDTGYQASVGMILPGSRRKQA